MVNLLRPNYRSIVDLIYFKGLSYAEVAKALCLPMGTVKTRRQAGVTALKIIYAEADNKIFYS